MLITGVPRSAGHQRFVVGCQLFGIVSERRPSRAEPRVGTLSAQFVHDLPACLPFHSCGKAGTWLDGIAIGHLRRSRWGCVYCPWTPVAAPLIGVNWITYIVDGYACGCTLSSLYTHYMPTCPRSVLEDDCAMVHRSSLVC